MTFRSVFPQATQGRRSFAQLLALFSLFVLLAFCHAAQAAEAAPSWKQLSPAQQQILSPLQADWHKFDHDRKKKWLDIATRYPAMSPEQQKILQRRMNEWAHLSPEKRRLARETFLSTGKAPLQSRREAWEAYKKLPESERERLKEEARHPKPHPGQVGKYLQEKQKRDNNLPPVPVKAHAPAPAQAPNSAAKPAPTTAAPPDKPASMPRQSASRAVS
ncbi:MAG: hypothetical protein B7Z83_03190 [Thiomonas sp. 20-64-5]|nr:MAG: hypothetical protein B7Z83_03190 [Thiomonas sp. 20-64-5]